MTRRLAQTLMPVNIAETTYISLLLFSWPITVSRDQPGRIAFRLLKVFSPESLDDELKFV
jgi:hypothetical protein